MSWLRSTHVSWQSLSEMNGAQSRQWLLMTSWYAFAVLLNQYGLPNQYG